MEQNDRLAVHTAGRMLRLMSIMLSKARERARVSFVEEIEYFYVDRSMLASNISQNFVKARWYKDVAVRNRLRLNSDPEAVIVDCQCGIDERFVLPLNIELYGELAQNRKHFELMVRRNVFVERPSKWGNGSKSFVDRARCTKSSEYENRSIIKLFILLAADLKFVWLYIGENYSKPSEIFPSSCPKLFPCM